MKFYADNYADYAFNKTIVLNLTTRHLLDLVFFTNDLIILRTFVIIQPHKAHQSNALFYLQSWCELGGSIISLI